jgi:hypothetical protein
MTSHFGIVVVDGNKRGENEDLTEEEKRQMYAACFGKGTEFSRYGRCLDIETWLIQHASDVGASLQVLISGFVPRDQCLTHSPGRPAHVC